jgi:hypothetical protein
MELEMRTKDGRLIATFKNKCALLQFDLMHRDRINFKYTTRIIKGQHVPVFETQNDVYAAIAGDIEIYLETNSYTKVI